MQAKIVVVKKQEQNDHGRIAKYVYLEIRTKEKQICNKNIKDIIVLS
jgi:hypothetical protein